MNFVLRKALLASFIAAYLSGCQSGKAEQENQQSSTEPQDSLVYDTAPRWSKTGDQILFYSYRNDPEGAELYTIKPDGSGLDRVTNTFFNEWWSDLSESGLIYTSSDKGKSNRFDGSELFLINKDNSMTQLTRSQDTSIFNIYPRLSPDGQLLLYCGNCLGKEVDSEIMLINVDGTNPVNLSNHPSMDRYASWSPDGKRIIFESNRGGNFDLYLLTISTMELTQLTDHPADEIHADWSGNDEIVFISNRDGDRELYLMNLDGSNVRQLTDNDADDVLPSWSPNGLQIVFSTYRHGNNDKGDIYLINADGTNELRLTKR